jgi:hypothetical protein
MELTAYMIFKMEQGSIRSAFIGAEKGDGEVTSCYGRKNRR